MIGMLESGGGRGQEGSSSLCPMGPLASWLRAAALWKTLSQSQPGSMRLRPRGRASVPSPSAPLLLPSVFSVPADEEPSLGPSGADTQSLRVLLWRWRRLGVGPPSTQPSALPRVYALRRRYALIEWRNIHDMQQQARSGEVLQKLNTEPGSFGSSLNKSRNIRHDEAL